MTELVISSPHHTEGDSPFRGGEVISAALPLISMSPKKEEATCNATAIAIMANLHPLPQLCQSITSLECHSVAERIEPFLSLLDSLSFLFPPLSICWNLQELCLLMSLWVPRAGVLPIGGGAGVS